jgi:hypothetical protein
MRGTIKLPWALDDHDLSGTCQLKLSLKTGDEATARARWGQVNGQVEDLLEATNRTIRQASTEPQPMRRAALSPAELATLAGQGRHDVPSQHDVAWIKDTTHMPSDLARGLKAAITQVRDGTLTRPLTPSEMNAASGPLVADIGPILLTARDMEDMLNARFPEGLDDNGVRAAARAAELDALRESLRNRDTGVIDRPPVLREGLDSLPGGGYELAETPQIRVGELTTRLAENGVELTDESERRKAALAILRAKITALEDAELSDQGRAIETPPPPT